MLQHPPLPSLVEEGEAVELAGAPRRLMSLAPVVSALHVRARLPDGEGFGGNFLPKAPFFLDDLLYLSQFPPDVALGNVYQPDGAWHMREDRRYWRAGVAQ